MAHLVDLTSALFEILMPNFMLVSPFERSPRHYKTIHFSRYLATFGEIFSDVLFKLNTLS